MNGAKQATPDVAMPKPIRLGRDWLRNDGAAVLTTAFVR